MLHFSNRLGFKEILLNSGGKKASFKNFTSLKPKCQDLAIVTPLNNPVVNVFWALKLSHFYFTNAPFLGQSADLKKSAALHLYFCSSLAKKIF